MNTAWFVIRYDAFFDFTPHDGRYHHGVYVVDFKRSRENLCTIGESLKGTFIDVLFYDDLQVRKSLWLVTGLVFKWNVADYAFTDKVLDKGFELLSCQ